MFELEVTQRLMKFFPEIYLNDQALILPTYLPWTTGIYEMLVSIKVHSLIVQNTVILLQP
jgi:hypothetical protein